MATKEPSPIRVHQLAKELGVNSKDILSKCVAEGIEGMKDHLSPVSVGLANTVREWFGNSAQHTAVETAQRVDVDAARSKPGARRLSTLDSGGPSWTNSVPLPTARSVSDGTIEATVTPPKWPTVVGSPELGSMSPTETRMQPQPVNPMTQIQQAHWFGIDVSLLTANAFASMTPPLVVPDSLARDLATYIATGQHLLLVGPPGCGKTEIAKAIPRILFDGTDHSFTLATAHGGWSTQHVVGGLRLIAGETKFVPGCFTRAVQRAIATRGRHWLILDEINRTDIDRVLGAAFTALQDFVLRIDTPLDEHHPIPIEIPRSFRVIATMNSVDRASLFPMSNALLRRFAIVHVAPPGSTSAERGAIEADLKVVLSQGRGMSAEEIATLDLGQDFIATLTEVLDFFERLRGLARDSSGGAPELDLGTSQVKAVARAMLFSRVAEKSEVNTAVDAAVCAFVYPQLLGLDHRALRLVVNAVGSNDASWPQFAARVRERLAAIESIS